MCRRDSVKRSRACCETQPSEPAQPVRRETCPAKLLQAKDDSRASSAPRSGYCCVGVARFAHANWESCSLSHRRSLATRETTCPMGYSNALRSLKGSPGSFLRSGSLDHERAARLLKGQHGTAAGAASESARSQHEPDRSLRAAAGPRRASVIPKHGGIASSKTTPPRNPRGPIPRRVRHSIRATR